MQTRPVAMLDVDNTLLFDVAGKINNKLLDALKNQGIVDIYLFTDMVFNVRNVEERKTLIKKLAMRGFTVHGVIVPSDIVWKDVHDIQEHEFFTQLNNYSGRFSGFAFEKFLKKLSGDNKACIAFQNNVKQYVPGRQCIGKGFLDACDELQAKKAQQQVLEIKDPHPMLITALQSQMGRAFAYQLAKQKGYIKTKNGISYEGHVKGLMLDLFLKHKPDWVSSIILADDTIQVINTIANFHPVDSTTVVPPITTIHVPRNYNAAIAYHYDGLLAEHIAKYAPELPKFVAFKKTIALIIADITQYILSMQAEWGFFKRSKAPKLAALSILINNFKAIQDCLPNPPLTINNIIEAWQQNTRAFHRYEDEKTNVSIALVLAEQRNMFRGRERPEVLTATEIFVETLKTRYGDLQANFVQNKAK